MPRVNSTSLGAYYPRIQGVFHLYTCFASSSTLDPAARATSWNLSGNSAMMSSVWVPIEPVEPSNENLCVRDRVRSAGFRPDGLLGCDGFREVPYLRLRALLHFRRDAPCGPSRRRSGSRSYLRPHHHSPLVVASATGPAGALRLRGELHLRGGCSTDRLGPRG